MSLIKKLEKIKDTLNTIDATVYHYKAFNQTKDYIVWAESGEADSFHGDNRKTEQVITGTIDFFTKTEYSTIIDDIQNALNNAEISFLLNSVQYEEETNIIHYEWTFEV